MKINPSKFIQRFIDIMSINHEVEILHSLRVRNKCGVEICVDHYLYSFVMYDGSNRLLIEKFHINRMLQNENSFVGWSSFYNPQTYKQCIEIEITEHVKSKIKYFDYKYKYQELRTWKKEK